MRGKRRDESVHERGARLAIPGTLPRNNAPQPISPFLKAFDPIPMLSKSSIAPHHSLFSRHFLQSRKQDRFFTASIRVKAPPAGMRVASKGTVVAGLDVRRLVVDGVEGADEGVVDEGEMGGCAGVLICLLPRC